MLKLARKLKRAYRSGPPKSDIAVEIPRIQYLCIAFRAYPLICKGRTFVRTYLAARFRPYITTYEKSHSLLIMWQRLYVHAYVQLSGLNREDRSGSFRPVDIYDVHTPACDPVLHFRAAPYCRSVVSTEHICT
jgi:hypothetical protein